MQILNKNRGITQLHSTSLGDDNKAPAAEFIFTKRDDPTVKKNLRVEQLVSREPKSFTLNNETVYVVLTDVHVKHSDLPTDEAATVVKISESQMGCRNDVQPNRSNRDKLTMHPALLVKMTNTAACRYQGFQWSKTS